MDNGKRLPFKIALNASTLRPFKLDVEQQISIAAEAGYQGIELWVRDIEEYLSKGGSLHRLRSHIADAGIEAVNGIAFFKWADSDDSVREQGLRQAAEEMAMLAGIGCSGVAAPPCGDVGSASLDGMARSFERLSAIARGIGITPFLEFWGRAKKLSRISEALYVAVESGVPDAKILLDLFHMHTGGSKVSDVGFMDGGCIGIVHVNDYPGTPARETIADRDRLFPGEGVGPTAEFARLLLKAGYRGFLSLELFIESYGSKSALEVAIEGVEKVRRAYSV